MPKRPSIQRPAPERVPGVAAGGEEEALLRGIAAVPEDDAARLVYADWLEEQGRGDQAAFVRLQCELAGVLDVESKEDSFSPRTELEARCDVVTPRREGAWSAPAGIEFQRGLPSVLTCGPREFTERGREWLAEAPTTHVLRLPDAMKSNRDVRTLATAEHLSQITRLSVPQGTTPAALEILLGSSHLANITDLDLSELTLRTRSSLADAHHLTRLTRLDLNRCNIGEARFAELLRSSIMGGLFYLGLRGCGLSDFDFQQLAALLKPSIGWRQGA